MLAVGGNLIAATNPSTPHVVGLQWADEDLVVIPEQALDGGEVQAFEGGAVRDLTIDGIIIQSPLVALKGEVRAINLIEQLGYRRALV